MTPAGNFFEPWDLPRLHPGRPSRSLRLENEGFWSAFRIVGVLSFLFRFFNGFSEFWPKCVPGHSQNQFYQTYWVENCTARFFSYKSWKEDLPRLINTSSYKLECFLTIFENFKIFRKLLKWLVPSLET